MMEYLGRIKRARTAFGYFQKNGLRYIMKWNLKYLGALNVKLKLKINQIQIFKVYTRMYLMGNKNQKCNKQIIKEDQLLLGSGNGVDLIKNVRQLMYIIIILSLFIHLNQFWKI